MLDVHAFGAKRSQRGIADGVGRQTGDVGAVAPELRQTHGDVRFTTAERGVQGRRLKEPLEPWWAQAQHDFAEANGLDHRLRTHRRAAARVLNSAHEVTRVRRNDIESPFVDGGPIHERRSDADRGCPGANPIASVVAGDATGWHEANLRKWASNVLEVAGPERGRGKHLDEIGAFLPRVENLGWRETARHDRDVEAMASLDETAPEHRADHEPR